MSALLEVSGLRCVYGRKIEALRSFYFFQAAERRVSSNPAAQLRSPRRPARLPSVRFS